MTPGFAKSRKELFWLPYPEPDRVIINAHNFTPAWSAAVNGKMPIAAWIPSRDTAGNGTTTLTDLVGTNNGTLTNMDAATDWVTDTGSGGVRAIDFDGVNDCVQFGGIVAANSARSVSLWFRVNAIGTTHYLFGNETNADLAYGLGIYVRSNNRLRFYNYDANRFIDASASVAATTWHHALCVWDGTNSLLYFDGTLSATGSGDSGIWSSGLYAAGKWNMGSLFFAGRLDDIRIWNQGLNAADASSLYDSGAGRGV